MRKAGLTPSLTSSRVSPSAATEGDREIASLADHVFYVPDTAEPLQPLLTAVPPQLIACHAALIRDCNVDKPTETLQKA